MAGLVSKSSTAMKLLIFAIAVVTLGAISQAETANIEFGEAKTRFKYARAADGKALLRPWEYDWRRHTNLPRGCFVTRLVTTCGVISLQSVYICR
jgi:hypothetical protein